MELCNKCKKCFVPLSDVKGDCELDTLCGSQTNHVKSRLYPAHNGVVSFKLRALLDFFDFRNTLIGDHRTKGIEELIRTVKEQIMKLVRCLSSVLVYLCNLCWVDCLVKICTLQMESFHVKMLYKNM